MKKLMIMAAIVCAAVASQAASIKWQISDNSDTAAVGNLVYLVTSSGTFETAADVVAAALTITSGSNSGTIIAGRTGETLSGTAVNTSWADASTVKFYYVVLDAETTSEATGYWITSQQSATAVGTGTPTTSKYTSLGTLVSGTMTKFKEDVPEPTSGLLILLGMGVLAIRRRRA